MSQTIKKLLALIGIIAVEILFFGVMLGFTSIWWGIGEGIVAAIIVISLFPAEATQ